MRRKRLDPTKQGSGYERAYKYLARRVFGQDDAIRGIADVWQKHHLRLTQEGRPLANTLLLGPTGTGKTYVVETFAEFVTDKPNGFTRIDCAEFQHSHEIAKLIGSPPGYLGHNETTALLIRERIVEHSAYGPHIVLFDEIEKASSALWDLLLGILDKATLTLGNNRRVDFSDVFVFMTGNLGAREMQAASMPTGFSTGRVSLSHDRLSDIATGAARKRFSPEFMNRIDRTVVFRPLDRAMLRDVVVTELARVQRRMRDARTPFYLQATESAIERLIQDGVSVEYGARYLKRLIETEIVQPLASLIGSDQIALDDTIEIDWDAGYAFTRTAARTQEAVAS